MASSREQGSETAAPGARAHDGRNRQAADAGVADIAPARPAPPQTQHSALSDQDSEFDGLADELYASLDPAQLAIIHAARGRFRGKITEAHKSDCPRCGRPLHHLATVNGGQRLRCRKCHLTRVRISATSELVPAGLARSRLAELRTEFAPLREAAGLRRLHHEGRPRGGREGTTGQDESDGVNCGEERAAGALAPPVDRDRGPSGRISLHRNELTGAPIRPGRSSSKNSCAMMTEVRAGDHGGSPARAGLATGGTPVPQLSTQHSALSTDTDLFPCPGRTRPHCSRPPGDLIAHDFLLDGAPRGRAMARGVFVFHGPRQEKRETRKPQIAQIAQKNAQFLATGE